MLFFIVLHSSIPTYSVVTSQRLLKSEKDLQHIFRGHKFNSTLSTIKLYKYKANKSYSNNILKQTVSWHQTTWDYLRMTSCFLNHFIDANNNTRVESLLPNYFSCGSLFTDAPVTCKYVICLEATYFFHFWSYVLKFPCVLISVSFISICRQHGTLVHVWRIFYLSL